MDAIRAHDLARPMLSPGIIHQEKSHVHSFAA